MNAPEAGTYEGLLGALVSAVMGSVFAAADAALSSLSRARISALHSEAKGLSKAALGRYLANPTAQHAEWLAGRVVFTALAAVLVAKALAPYAPSWALAPLGALGALITFGTLAQIGTTLGRARPDGFATRFLLPMRPLELLVWPLAAPLSRLGLLTSSLLGPQGPPKAAVTKNEVEWVVSEGAKHGTLEEEPAEMIRNVLELKNRIVRDVMIPRTRICGIEADTPLPEVLRIVATEGHSRFPVYREKIDNVLGLLYAKDLFPVLEGKALRDVRLRELLRSNVIFVPEVQTVASVLHEMRSHRLHMAIVIDEFGGVSGVVTLEDILEVIVGDIRDEYDTEEAPIEDLGGGRLVADAAVSVHDLSAYLGANIAAEGDYESLGGLLVHKAGQVPPVGSQHEAFGLTFIVRDADERRIARVEILRPADSLSPPSDPSSRGPARSLAPAGSRRISGRVSGTPGPSAPRSIPPLSSEVQRVSMPDPNGSASSQAPPAPASADTAKSLLRP